ncbi:oligosaccharide flippase family protein [Sphingomonas sp. AOB5]|uniref:oligosaccharide flippase family protein n=1 Tax=Sphingomonas sp. AOB5 TaxID=3034017 RepID=UPI0023F8D6FB|nr:oligosaccharide flippase family protein [Sphingomonas sp. AOB5]MDF7774421.1 oligosaccharide flippase family protein [Sphingomonas sp. AOB5]
MKEVSLSGEEVRTRAARGAMSVFTRHALVRLMAFGGTLVLARMIDPHTFGVFALAQFVLLLANGIAVGGVTTALTRRRETVTPLEYKTAHSIQLAVAVVIFAAVAAATPLLALAYDLTASEALAFPALGSAVFLLASRSIPTAALQRGLRHDLVAVSEVAEYVTYVAVSIGLALAGLGLWALVIATLLRYSVATVLLYRAAHAWPAVAFDRPIARTIVRETLPQQAAILLGLAQRGINTTVVAAVFNPAAAGLVGMALTLLDSLVLQPLALLANIQFRLLARVQDDADQFRKLLGQSFFVSSVVCMPILIAAIILFPLFVTILFPPAWYETSYLVQVLSISSFCYLVGMPSHQALKALGDAGSLIICYILSLVAQLVILLGVSGRFGLQGFAVANIIGTMIQMVFGLVRLRMITGRFPPLAPFAGVALAAAIATTVGLGAAALVSGTAGVVAGVLFGGLGYLVALFVTSAGQMATILGLASESLPARLAKLRGMIDALGGIADRCHVLKKRVLRDGRW